MKKTIDLAGYKATLSRLRTLLLRERVLSGTLNVQMVRNAKRYTLTDKVEGKTRCLYVPVSMEAKVRRYTENWKTLKALLLEMSEWTRVLLAEEISETTGRTAPGRRKVREGAADGAPKGTGGRAGRRSRGAT